VGLTTERRITETQLCFVSELLNLDGLMQFAKENVGTLSSLLESLWEILKGNISLVFYSVLTLFSVVLGGGSAVINFLVNSVRS